MAVAVILLLLGGYWGWRRAARRGGTTADRWQYAAAHGLPAFLIGMIVMTIAGHLGWLG